MRPKGLSVRASQKSPELCIYGDIGPSWAGMIDGDSVVRALRELPRDHQRVIVRINSPGGDVFEGFTIYNALVRHPAEVVVEVDGLAASAASLIAMAGRRIRIAANAMMMIHRSWVVAGGNANELRQVVEILRQVDDNLCTTYSARTRQPKTKVWQWLDAETWMQAEDAVLRGFADEVGQALQIAAHVPAGRYKNTPRQFTTSSHAAPPAGPVSTEAIRDRLDDVRDRLIARGILAYVEWRPGLPR